MGFCEFCGIGSACGVCGRPAPNVRFWTWSTEGYVKLVLRPGERLSRELYSTDSEGWSVACEAFEYDADEGVVTREVFNDGTDCDGRFSSGRTFVCPVGSLAGGDEAADWSTGEAVPQGFRLPAWERAESYQRDYAAEAMGY